MDDQEFTDLQLKFSKYVQHLRNRNENEQRNKSPHRDVQTTFDGDILKAWCRTIYNTKQDICKRLN
jgi:hypothetical protein